MSDLKEAIEMNKDHLVLNNQIVTKEELEKQIESAKDQPGVSIRHEGNGTFRRKISG